MTSPQQGRVLTGPPSQDLVPVRNPDGKLIACVDRKGSAVQIQHKNVLSTLTFEDGQWYATHETPPGRCESA